MAVRSCRFVSSVGVEILNRLQDGLFFLFCVLSVFLFMFDFLLELFQCPPFSLDFVGQRIGRFLRHRPGHRSGDSCDQDINRVPAVPLMAASFKRQERYETTDRAEQKPVITMSKDT